MLLAVFVFANPYRAVDAMSQTARIMYLLMGLAAGAFIAAYLRKPAFTLLIAALSLALGGAYLMLTPGVFKWIGIGNMVTSV